MIFKLFGKKDDKAPVAEAPGENGKASFFDRMKQAVTRTRQNLGERIEEAVGLRKTIDRATLDELEAALLSADLGTVTTAQVLASLRDKAAKQQIQDGEELKAVLKSELLAILRAAEKPEAERPSGEPLVMLIVGVNGVGKTTTIGKLTHTLQQQDKKVLLCAADTFRAAAIEQLEIWAQRTGTELVKSASGGDPSAVLFDALTAAKARNTDVVLVDTAGRLHNKAGLMAELDKMCRTASRIVPGAPHETLLIMDATTGQNGLQQARVFTESCGVTGIVLTKLDGTAKGGVVVAISRELGLPVRFVGVGEKLADLLPFDAEAFVDSLFD
jgi:fused signal recognition particle receptor